MSFYLSFSIQSGAMQPGPSLVRTLPSPLWSDHSLVFQFALLWVVSDVSQAIPIFNLLGGRGGGGGSQRPKCRYVPQTAYFPTYDTVYKQECSTHYENQCSTEVNTQPGTLSLARNVQARLSLVESFRVLLAPAILCHKEPVRSKE